MAENIALAEALVTGAREGGVIWDIVFQTQAAEPSICKVDLHLPANLTLRSNGEDVTHNEHPDHEHRVDRWAADRRVVGRKLGMDPGKVQHRANLPDEMIFRDYLVEAELVEQLALVPIEPPHHGPPPPPIASRRWNHCSPPSSTEFCNNICQEQPFQPSVTRTTRASNLTPWLHLHASRCTSRCI